MRRRFGGLSDESALKRVPRGFDADHAGARWLRLQSFTVGQSLSDEDVTSAKLTRTLDAGFGAMLPLVRWLNGVLGLAPAKSR